MTPEDPTEEEATERLFESIGTLDTEALWAAVRHPDPIVRSEAASSPALSYEQLQVLAKDTEWTVRERVGRLPYDDIQVLMAADPDPMIRATVAGPDGPDPADVPARRIWAALRRRP